MRSFRAKPIGWRGDSHRHYLAAKGIKSKFSLKESLKNVDYKIIGRRKGRQPFEKDNYVGSRKYGIDSFKSQDKFNKNADLLLISATGKENRMNSLHEYIERLESKPVRDEFEDRALKDANAELLRLKDADDDLIRTDYRNYPAKKMKMYPTDVAFEMRRKGSGLGEMEQKRTDEYMDRLEESMRQKGFTEPIPADAQEIAEGRLQEGKHRLIVAKKLGLKEVPVEVQYNAVKLKRNDLFNHDAERYEVVNDGKKVGEIFVKRDHLQDLKIEKDERGKGYGREAVEKLRELKGRELIGKVGGKSAGFWERMGAESYVRDEGEKLETGMMFRLKVKK